ncbi:3-hydroxyacyl-CoA dehydrogenase family protein [Kutzneria sp. CA-103260]|uniref:3-hydroxyacyl-CoA dehydrogenase family protein n=1 Tax=Kutzneria sp. CA-103260 TaxID=2802641 RepID=UPI001BAAE504|nr:3-hydroxyacyl-CoA dehydrogenase family protein [Kutzneria sp. CA-103260]QUQ64651.1 3-hydroxybutyryl-CoA dehydrogenase [Kutzneria sp. CA-103260]
MVDPWHTNGIAVIGAGVMGVGIAALAVAHGLPVTLVDIDDDKLARAPELVTSYTRVGMLMGKLPRGGTPGTLTTATTLDAAAPAWAVVEAVTEHAETKAKVLAELSTVVDPGTLLATNTSAIPVAELAAATIRPADLLATHFMNPPYLIDAVEVARGAQTGDAAMARLGELFELLGRRAIVVGDGPGFVSNHVLMRMINDAARLVTQGRAEPARIDEVFTECLGHRTGPLATADLIGLDNVVDTLAVLFERTGEDAYRADEELVARVRAGRHGRKSGAGFYDYGSTA